MFTSVQQNLVMFFYSLNRPSISFPGCTRQTIRQVKHESNNLTGLLVVPVRITFPIFQIQLSVFAMASFRFIFCFCFYLETTFCKQFMMIRCFIDDVIKFKSIRTLSGFSISTWWRPEVRRCQEQQWRDDRPPFSRCRIWLVKKRNGH